MIAAALLIALCATQTETATTTGEAQLPRASASRNDCGRCHTTAGWSPAKFDHAWTGWALRGEHAEARCRSCHAVSLHAPVSRSCASCHRDAHAGALGLQCAGCHQETSWRSRFDATAHRNTAFPLSGAHAAIPCEECHSAAPGDRFSRAGAACLRCHEADYRRAALTSIDHLAAGFGTACASCHSAWRFTGARFFEHDACFTISRGAHSGLGCKSCHATLAGARTDGSCSTTTAACTSCHEHRCETSDAQHASVPGYQCADQKCYQCHQSRAP